MIRKSNYIDNNLKEPITYYCKDCEKFVEVKPVGRKFVYKCAVCSTKNVAFGTKKSLISYYHIKEEGKTYTMSEEEKKAVKADKF